LKSQWAVVATLGSAQALAWASSFYLPAVLAEPIARDIGLSPISIYAALSFGLGISALFGPLAGALIDGHGGRPVLCASNLLFAVGLGLLSIATGPESLFFAWFVLGIAMAFGFLESAFAALARLYGAGSHTLISGITIVTGFASTAGWPISAVLEHRFNWRCACVSWAALHLSLGLSLNAWAFRVSAPRSARLPEVVMPAPIVSAEADRRMQTLTFVFTASGIVTSGLAANLPGLFAVTGLTPTAAIAAASLMGPAQIGARILEFSGRRWSNPLISAKVGTVLHSLSAVALSIGGGPIAPLFSIIYGAGNGILTITRGTLPLTLFGPQGYGARIGRLLWPAKVGQAVAPFVVAVAIEHMGIRILLIALGLSVAALTSLHKLSIPAAAR
jgi:MFS family permease